MRDLALKTIAKHQNLRIFHLGHYEHSDCECKSVVPQDPVFANYSAQGVMVSQIFKDPSNFPKLHELWLEKHCDLTKFLQNMISQYRSPE